MAYALSVSVFVSLTLLVYGIEDNEIDWGYKSSNCVTDHLVHPVTEKSYDAPGNEEPIVGVFAVRDDPSSKIWGSGFYWYWGYVQFFCYDECRANFVRTSGTYDNTYSIDVMLSTEYPKTCLYGYTVTVCFRARIRRAE